MTIHYDGEAGREAKREREAILKAESAYMKRLRWRSCPKPIRERVYSRAWSCLRCGKLIG